MNVPACRGFRREGKGSSGPKGKGHHPRPGHAAPLTPAALPICGMSAPHSGKRAFMLVRQEHSRSSCARAGEVRNGCGKAGNRYGYKCQYILPLQAAISLSPRVTQDTSTSSAEPRSGAVLPVLGRGKESTGPEQVRADKGEAGRHRLSPTSAAPQHPFVLSLSKHASAPPAS